MTPNYKGLIYPVVEDFTDRMCEEVDHALEKHPDDNVMAVPIYDAYITLKNEVWEVGNEISISNVIYDRENLKRELAQVACVCMMMYAKLEER